MSGKRDTEDLDSPSVDLGRAERDRPLRLRKTVQDVIVILSENDLRVIGFSEAAGRLAEIREDLPPPPLGQFVSEQDQLRIRAATADAAEHGSSSPVPFSYRDGRGHWHLVTAIVEDARRADDCPGWLLRFNADVERPLGTTLYEGVTRYSSEAIFVIDRDWTIVDCSAAVRNVFGVAPSEVLGQPLMPGHVADEDYERVVEAWRRVMAANTGYSELVRHKSSMPDGSIQWFETRLTNLIEDPMVQGLVANARIVTEEQHALEQLRRRAELDPLTGLANRFLIETWLQEALDEADAADDGAAVPARRWVLLLDMYGFKQINDTYGHPTGDEVLRMLARRLANAGGNRRLGRFGGDEFVVVGEPDEDPDELFHLLRAELERPFDGVAASGWQLGLSAGSAPIMRAREPGELLRRADVALVAAKSTGRSRHLSYDGDLDAVQTQRRFLGQQVRRALADDQFEMRYEPVASLADGRILGCEALIRWRHPWRGLLAPDEFMSTAEDEGLEGELDFWVANQVVIVAAEWARSGHDLRVSLNLSAQGLARGYAAHLERACREVGLDPAVLTVELLESIRPHPELEGPIADLRRIGVGLAIDDFGTGYSSLAAMHRLEANSVKIDGVFVSDVEDDAGSRAIVEAAVSVAKVFGMEVVAEWVERDSQCKALLELGVHAGQGALFGNAVTAEDFTRIYLDTGAAT